MAAARATGGWPAAVELLAASGDPATAQRLAANDWYRLERALEIVTCSGRPVGRGSHLSTIYINLSRV